MDLFLSILGLIVIFEHILYLVLEFSLLVLNEYLPAGVVPRRNTYISMNMCFIPFKKLLLQQSTYYLKDIFSTIVRYKKVLRKEILKDYSLS